MAERTKITALDDGPLLVKGAILPLVAEGHEFPAERATVAPCRCGGSTTKPLCDDTHSRLGFRAAERAVRAKRDEAELASRRMM